jgi:hypothetical protein
VKKILFATASIAALGLVAPHASAQGQADPNIAHQELYMQQDQAGTYRLFGPDFPVEGQEVLYEGGVRPADCPEGAWFIEQDEQSDEFQQVRGCATGDMAYDVSPMTPDMLAARDGSTQGAGPNEDSYLVTPRAD